MSLTYQASYETNFMSAKCHDLFYAENISYLIVLLQQKCCTQSCSLSTIVNIDSSTLTCLFGFLHYNYLICDFYYLYDAGEIITNGPMEEIRILLKCFIGNCIFLSQFIVIQPT